jgi:hypothetical protein
LHTNSLRTLQWWPTTNWGQKRRHPAEDEEPTSISERSGWKKIPIGPRGSTKLTKTAAAPAVELAAAGQKPPQRSWWRPQKI